LVAPTGDPREESIADLVGRLVDDGKAYARAEIDLYKQIAAHRVGRARTGIALIGGAVVLLLSALIALTVGSVIALSALIGPFLAGLAIAAALGLIAWVLIRSGISGLKALKGSEEEAAALKRGESP
jgi:hypothetical protein